MNCIKKSGLTFNFLFLAIALNASSNDSTRPALLSSMGCYVSTGYSKHLNGFAGAFYRKSIENTILESYSWSIEGTMPEMKFYEMGVYAGMKINKIRNRYIRYAEAGLGLSLVRGSSRSAQIKLYDNGVSVYTSDD